MQKRKWAEEAVKELQSGRTIRIQPTGGSMRGRINEGDLVTLEPCSCDSLTAGDIVLARIQGRRYSLLVLHQILARDGDRFLIGSTEGRIDGWVTAQEILGRVLHIASKDS